MPITRVLAVCLLFSGILLRAQEVGALDTKLQAIAAAHHGRVTLFARNLRTGQTAAIAPDELVQTASVIKLEICWMRLVMAQPCFGSREMVFRISRSRVP